MQPPAITFTTVDASGDAHDWIVPCDPFFDLGTSERLMGLIIGPLSIALEGVFQASDDSDDPEAAGEAAEPPGADSGESWGTDEDDSPADPLDALGGLADMNIDIAKIGKAVSDSMNEGRLTALYPRLLRNARRDGVKVVDGKGRCTRDGLTVFAAKNSAELHAAAWEVIMGKDCLSVAAISDRFGLDLSSLVAAASTLTSLGPTSPGASSVPRAVSTVSTD